MELDLETTRIPFCLDTVELRTTCMYRVQTDFCTSSAVQLFQRTDNPNFGGLS
jgi:hypothetical protein